VAEADRRGIAFVAFDTSEPDGARDAQQENDPHEQQQ